MPKSLDKSHTHHAGIRGSMLQAEISNQSIRHPRTPEDQIEAAISGLAKTLTTGVPLQLHDDTVDKLCKLQEILEPRTDGHVERKVTAPTQRAPVPQQ